MAGIATYLLLIVGISIIPIPTRAGKIGPIGPLLKFNDTQEVTVQEHGKLLDASASAGGGPTYGAEAKAELGEIGARIGIVGGKLGLAADTGISVGKKNQLKLLGTGLAVDFSKGVEFCILGSCLTFGEDVDSTI